jgi:teichuronic acid exporter
MSILRKKTINGVLWGGFENFSSLGIQLLCTLIIARLLKPSDFGLIGMLTIFIALSLTIIESGFGQALIRKQNATDIDYSSVFYLNLIFGLILYFVLYNSTHLIAGFYKISELEKLAKYSFLIIPINSIGLIQFTLLTRRMDFKTLSVVSIFSALVSGILGILVALEYRNVWSLVVQSVAFYSIRTLLFWFVSSWRPILSFSFGSIRELLPFSVNLLLMGTIGVFFNNLYTLVIGKIFNSTELGYYTQADKIQKIPSTSITGVIQRVSFPVFSTMQDENERLKANHRKVFSMACYMVFPIMFFLIVIAKDLFDLLLTEKWRPAIIYFQLLCITGALYPAQSINLNILNIKGKGKMILQLEVVRKALLMAILAITINYNILVLIYGQIFFSLIALFIAFYYCGKEINLSIGQQLKDILPIFLSAIGMMLLVYIIGLLLSTTHIILRLVCQALTAFFSYYLLTIILGVHSRIEIEQILNNIIANRKQHIF